MAASSDTRITVRAYKYDGSEHRSWPAQILHRDGPLLVLSASFSEEVRHELLGTIPRGTLSIEYYWLDRWYNVFRFYKLNGQLRNYYCNVNVPPEFDGHDLKYVDLDIDILADEDLSYQVLDLPEFERNASRYGYSEKVREKANQAVKELQELIASGTFPFNHAIGPGC